MTLHLIFLKKNIKYLKSIIFGWCEPWLERVPYYAIFCWMCLQILYHIFVSPRDQKRQIYIYIHPADLLSSCWPKKSDEKESADLQTNMDKIIWRQFNLRTYINIISVRGERRVCPKWANINKPAFTTQMPPTSWARTACLFSIRFFFFTPAMLGCPVSVLSKKIK